MDDKITISTYEFLKQFPNAEAARTYLEARRWPRGAICPACGCVERIQTRKLAGYFRCLNCKTDFTVRTGTIFERSHVPLDKWLYAMYLMATARKGISSLQLSKELGVTQKTAWFMLQRIREACGNDKDDDSNGFLRGIVEADETYLGGKEANKHALKKLNMGLGAVGKTGILGMRERDGHVKAVVLNGTTAPEIIGHIFANVLPGSTVCTDEHASYQGLPPLGLFADIPNYDHRAVNHSAKEFVNGMAHTNGLGVRRHMPLMNNKPVTLINVFTVEPANQQQLIELLARATESSVRHAPGFISATLHRSLDGTKVTMYAQWRSDADYQAMRKDPSPLPFLQQALSIAKFEPGMYEIVETFTPADTDA